MTAKALKRRKGRFLGIPYNVVNSSQFASLRPPEVKLLVDVLLQYTGSNNGMQSACYSLMEKRGWAKSSLHRAFNKLQHSGFLIVTRQGWKRRGKPTLVALTWIEIDEPRNGVIYDEGIVSSNASLGYWFKPKNLWKHKPKVKEIQKSDSSNMGDKDPGYSPILELVVGGKQR